jgi:hypothetical protein
MRVDSEKCAGKKRKRKYKFGFSAEWLSANVCSYKRPKLFTAFYSKLIIKLLTTKTNNEKRLGSFVGAVTGSEHSLKELDHLNFALNHKKSIRL